MRILLIEDDTMIGEAVHCGLAQAGFTVDWVTDGRSAEPALANGCTTRRSSTWDCQRRMAWRS